MTILEKSPRLWPLDALRGVAIILMVAFHLIFDLKNFFGFSALRIDEGFWLYESRFAAILFIGLAGAVSALLGRQFAGRELWRKNASRGLRLIALGFLITLATRIAYPEWTIWFGILHFLGVAIVLSSFFTGHGWMNAAMGMAAIGIGFWFKTLRSTTPLWILFGVRPTHFQTFDYYPLFPWFGVLLLGIAAGHWWIEKKSAAAPPPRHAKPLLWLGKYSLWIYLIHQPVLLGILMTFRSLFGIK